MGSPVDNLNRIFHYDCVPEMAGFDYGSCDDFRTGIHDDTRSESLEKYAERSPESNVLDDIDAAVVYEFEFDGQPVEARLEYDAEQEIIGVDMDGGKRDKFVTQISDALDGRAEVSAKRKAPQP